MRRCVSVIMAFKAPILRSQFETASIRGMAPAVPKVASSACVNSARRSRHVSRLVLLGVLAILLSAKASHSAPESQAASSISFICNLISSKLLSSALFGSFRQARASASAPESQASSSMFFIFSRTSSTLGSVTPALTSASADARLPVSHASSSRSLIFDRMSSTVGSDPLTCASACDKAPESAHSSSISLIFFRTSSTLGSPASLVISVTVVCKPPTPRPAFPSATAPMIAGICVTHCSTDCISESPFASICFFIISAASVFVQNT
mmetsp:Transcript_409/g.747  ORF Transcript_409/g.747 Transcript_409/m.747 type:complete len:267 (-) Transcript_409:873-1673(-)